MGKHRERVRCERAVLLAAFAAGLAVALVLEAREVPVPTCGLSAELSWDTSKQFVARDRQELAAVGLVEAEVPAASRAQLDPESSAGVADPGSTGREEVTAEGRPDEEADTVTRQQTPLECDAALRANTRARAGLQAIHMQWRTGAAAAVWRRPDIPALVTLTTQLGPERLSRLEKITQRWRGPVSAAIRVCSADDLSQVSAWWANLSPETQAHLDLHLAVASADPYPINALRNVARAGVRSELDGFELVVDADAWVGGTMADMAHDLQAAVDGGFGGSDGRGSGIVFCLAALEPARVQDGKAQALPDSFESAVGLYRQGRLRPMHHEKRSYSGPFRHADWAQGGSAFVVHYEVMFEPYFCVRSPRQGASRIEFPEELRGRGFNKQALHFELFAAGYQHVALARSFVVDLPHESPDWSRSSVGIPENRPVFAQWRRRISGQYGLECREEDWERCTERRVGCHRVCQVHDAHPHGPQDARPRRKDGRKVAAAPEKRGAREASREEVHWKLYLETLVARSRAGERRAAGGKELCRGPDGAPQVDVVFTWVNGSDPAHAALQREHIPAEAFNAELEIGGRRRAASKGLAHRFRDFGHEASTLRFAMRSVRRFAPFVRTIWVVVAEGQRPSWLEDEDFGAVRLVTHDEIFSAPAEQLPTFNSCAIETQLHRIPGLAECYLYMNDDFILARALAFEDLISADGRPRVWLSGSRAPRAGRDAWQTKVANVGAMMHRDYGLRWEHIFGVGHHGYLFIQPLVQEALEAMSAEVERTSRERWRTPLSVWVPFVYANYVAWHYETEPAQTSAFYFALTTEGGELAVRTAFERVAAQRPQWLCINDLAGEISSEMRAALATGLAALVPAAASADG